MAQSRNFKCLQSQSFIWTKVTLRKRTKDTEQQTNKSPQIISLISKHNRPWLCHHCFNTTFKERCKSHTVTPQRISTKLKRKELLYYCKGDCGEGQVLDGNGQHERDSQKPTGGFPLTENSLQQSCQRYPVSNLPVLDPGAGTQGYNTQGRRCCEMKAWMKMEEGRFTDKGDGEGHLGAGHARIKGKRQTQFVENNEWDDVRKVALLPEKLLPLRYFKWRSKYLRVGIYPFLKVPQLLPQKGLGGSAYPMIKGQREQKNGWGALTQLTLQPWTPSDTGNIDRIAEKVKEVPSESANPTGWKLSAL